MEYKYDVTLSFAGEDRVYVEKTAQILVDNGIKVFYDKLTFAFVEMPKFTKKEDEHILTVETTGALKPREIILGGINELAKRLEEFKEIIANFKE